MNEAPVFTCSICDSESRDICVYCTKDACPNHLCLRCRRCSDCCLCEMPRTAVPTLPSSVEALSSNGHNPD